tara:strand:- start:135 stop:1943 length:1809 start_codon:yes stop_codon:yes gene_type:complete
MVNFLFFQNLIFVFFIFSNVIGYGYSLSFLFKIKEESFTNLFIYGSLMMILVSLILNFFLPLNFILTNSLFVFFTFLGFYKITKNINNSHNLYLFIFLVIFTSLIVFRSYPYADYEIYHLPYIEILKKYKIVFGLSNFNVQFGHTSIFQNIAALQYNSLMKMDSHIYFTTLLVNIILGEVLLNYRNNSQLIIKFISYIFIVNFFIHANRYGALGNDFPAHALSFFSYILFFKIVSSNKINNDFNTLIFCLIIAIFGKFSLFVNSFLILLLYFLKKEILKINFMTITLIIIVCISCFLKNLINTSCLLYPVSITCLETSWSADDYDFSDPKLVGLHNIVANKGLKFDAEKKPILADSDQIIIKKSTNDYTTFQKLSEEQKINFKKYLIYKNFNKTKIWTKNYYKGHFKNKIFNNLFLFLFVNVFVFFIYNGNYKFLILNNYNKFKLKTPHLLFVIFITLSSTIWFFTAPLFRYGISYLLLFICIPFLIYIVLYAASDKKILRFFNLIVCITFIYAISDNLVRINNFELKKNKTNTIVPLTYSSFKKIEIDNFKFTVPTQLEHYKASFCSFLEPLCLSFGNSEFLKSNFKVVEKNKYLFIKKQN